MGHHQLPQLLSDTFLELTNDAADIMVVKNHDYAGQGSGDLWANFSLTEHLGLCSVPTGILIRVADKMSRLSTFAAKGRLEVDNESYRDAVIDIINYLVLLEAYLKTHKG